MSRARIEPGDSKKKRHEVTIRCKEVYVQPLIQGQGVSVALEITTNADESHEPFVLDCARGEVFTVVIED